MIEIDGYLIDCAVREEHSHPSEVTKLPIERGGDTSDHNRELNDSVTIEGIVSDSPLGAIAAARGGSDKPSEEARARLLRIRSDRRPVKIVTSKGVYESMAMVDLSIRDSVEESGGLFFSAKFELQRIATVERVALFASASASSSGNLGNRPVKSFETTAEVHSIADKMWIDRDCQVELRSFNLTPLGYKRGVDVDNNAGSGNSLISFNVWRRSSRYDAKKRVFVVEKGPLRDGFNGTDKQIVDHVLGLTAEKRKALLPPSGKFEPSKAPIGVAERNKKLRVDDKGNVSTMSPGQPGYEKTKPYIVK